VKSDQEGLSVVHLKPGEVHITDMPEVVITVLGSCLSVTMFNRRLGVAGMCHSLLPECGNRETCRSGCREGYRYVDCSIRQMVRVFDKYGVPRSEIEVKCFGGADMFIRKSEKTDFFTVGKQNIIVAEKIIASEGLTLRAKDVGGVQGRKMLFYTHTGEVLLKRLRGANNPDIIMQEFLQHDTPLLGKEKDDHGQ
jgi:chemotaxis protein CheD